MATTTVAIEEERKALETRLRQLVEEELMVLDDAALMDRAYRLVDNLEEEAADVVYGVFAEVFERWSAAAVLEHFERDLRQGGAHDAEVALEIDAARESIERRHLRRVQLTGRDG